LIPVPVFGPLSRPDIIKNQISVKTGRQTPRPGTNDFRRIPVGHDAKNSIATQYERPRTLQLAETRHGCFQVTILEVIRIQFMLDSNRTDLKDVNTSPLRDRKFDIERVEIEKIFHFPQRREQSRQIIGYAKPVFGRSPADNQSFVLPTRPTGD